MITTLWIKVASAVALLVAFIVGYVWWDHHVFQQGVTQEKNRRDAIDAKNTIAAQKALGEANEKVRLAQSGLSDAINKLQDKQTELQNAKSTAASFQSDLLSSRKRLSVLISNNKSSTNQIGSVDSASTVKLDTQSTITAYLDPTVAAGLVGIVSTGDQAITRLNGCIAAYDAVKSASDALNTK